MKAKCCDVSCAEPAVWEIRDGDGPDDYVHACQRHVGDLLTYGAVNQVYLIEGVESEGKEPTP